jgi:hypothetical protein
VSALAGHGHHGSAEDFDEEDPRVGSREDRPADRRIQADQAYPQHNRERGQGLQRPPRQVRAALLLFLIQNGPQIDTPRDEDQAAERRRRACRGDEEVVPPV